MYSIYKGPNGEIVVISTGFNWMAFFFTWIWALIKQLWGLGINVLIIAFLTASLVGCFLDQFEKGVLSQDEMIGVYMCWFFIWLATSIICGMAGNLLEENKYRKKGYKMEKIVFAPNKNAVLVEYKNELKDK